MDHDRAFQEAIREQPDDDLARLAWADWLEEQGQGARAAFVRAHLALARLPEDDPARTALEDEADDLLAEHEAEWAGRVGLVALEWRWRRGCIEQVTVWADTLLEEGEALFDAAPIRGVRLLAETDDLARLAGCPFLGRLERLELGTGRFDSPYLGPYHRDQALQGLLVSRHLGRLAELDLRAQGVEGPLVKTLADTGLLGRLRCLDLSGNRALGERAVRHLAEAGAERLVRLGLEDTNVGGAGLRFLLESARKLPALRALEANLGLLFRGGAEPAQLESELLQTPLAGQLTSLTIQGVALAGAKLETILRSPLAPRLEALTLRTCTLGEPEAQALAASANLAGLRRLHLHGNELRDKGARALAGSPHLAGLTSLDVGNNGIGGPGLKALLSAPGLPGLTRLDLSGNFVGASGAELLARAEVPRRLTWLHLGRANLGPEAAAVLAGSPALSRLRVLWLDGNRLGEGIRFVADSPHLARLAQLHLDSNDIDPAGAQALLESPYLQRVRQLSMRNAYITSMEREQLRARFGAGTQF
jgi:uncharacterized protein (TIGR02996 family)